MMATLSRDKALELEVFNVFYTFTPAVRSTEYFEPDDEASVEITGVYLVGDKQHRDLVDYLSQETLDDLEQEILAFEGEDDGE